MRASTVITCNPATMPGRDPGAHDVLEVMTALPRGEMNSFYIDPVDLAGVPIRRPLANQPDDAPIDPEAMNLGDPIEFDVQEGIHKVVLWKRRRIRQRGYSFDAFATLK